MSRADKLRLQSDVADANLTARVQSLEAEIASLKAAHAMALLLKEAEVKLAMQPLLQDAYTRGKDDEKKALSDARAFLQQS